MEKEEILQVRMDKDLKDAAEKVYTDLGTSLSEAVRVFLKKSVENKL